MQLKEQTRGKGEEGQAKAGHNREISHECRNSVAILSVIYSNVYSTAAQQVIHITKAKTRHLKKV